MEKKTKKKKIKKSDLKYYQFQVLQGLWPEGQSDLSDVFGTLNTKVSGQKFKNMCRSSWS